MTHPSIVYALPCLPFWLPAPFSVRVCVLGGSCLCLCLPVCLSMCLYVCGHTIVPHTQNIEPCVWSAIYRVVHGGGAGGREREAGLYVPTCCKCGPGGCERLLCCVCGPERLSDVLCCVVYGVCV